MNTFYAVFTPLISLGTYGRFCLDRISTDLFGEMRVRKKCIPAYFKAELLNPKLLLVILLCKNMALGIICPVFLIRMCLRNP